MKVLLLGAGGQLGRELQETLPDNIELNAYSQSELDITSTDALDECIATVKPDTIINAAAYTAVDRSEEETELAMLVNCHAVRNLAEMAKRSKILLAHVSTDFVFSGVNHKPYSPNDPTGPEGAYGLSKLKGEEVLRDVLGDQALIIRTAWLYSAFGNNFVKTMLQLMATKPRLAVIDEQIGTPTWARGLAEAIWRALAKQLVGTFHWTDAGVASWYDFAVAIQEEALSMGLLKSEIPILPIPASQYPTPAKRPFYSVLDKTGFWSALDLQPVHWRKQLRSMLQQELPKSLYRARSGSAN